MIAKIDRLRSSWKFSWKQALLCASFLLPYFAATLPRLQRLGIFSSEAMVATAATSYWRIAGWNESRFSPQLGMYHGSLESVIVSPVLLLFGYTAPVLRLTMILWGAATLLAVFMLARELFRDSAAAWLSAWMLATLPAFISGTYLGIQHASMMLFFQASGLAALLRWTHEGRSRYLYASFCLFGCGLACRLWFTGALAASAASVLVLVLAEGRISPVAAERERSPRRLAFLALLCFFMGALPVALVILNNGLHFWAALPPMLFAESHKVRFPQTYPDSLTMRFAAVRSMLTGDHLLREPFPAMNYAAPLVAQAAACAFIWLPLSCLFRGGGIPVVRRMLLPIYVAVLLAVLSVSGHYESNHQLLLIPPLILMTAAAAADLAGRIAGKRRSAAVIVFLALCWPAVTRPWLLQRQLMTMTDSPPEYTDAIPAAASWLDANPLPGPLLADAGLVQQLQFYLTRRTQFVIIPDSDHSFPEGASQAAYYITFHPDQISRLDPLFSNARLAVERLGGQAAIAAQFYDRGGKPMIRVYRLPRPRPDLNALLVRRS